MKQQRWIVFFVMIFAIPVIFNGLSYAQTSRRNQKQSFCDNYANTALQQVEQRNATGQPADVSDRVWTSDYKYHFKWCMEVPEDQANARTQQRSGWLGQNAGQPPDPGQGEKDPGAKRKAKEKLEAKRKAKEKPQGDTGQPGQQGPTIVPPPSYTTTIILGTFIWDVESNTQGVSSVSDFWWNQATETERYLTVMNGSKWKLISNRNFDTIDIAFIQAQALDQTPLSGSDNNAVLNPGTIVVFRTAEGNFGKMQVEGYRALQDFSFPEADAYLDNEWREMVLNRPHREKYHLQVKWQLFR